jgi:hypothetical protein
MSTPVRYEFVDGTAITLHIAEDGTYESPAEFPGLREQTGGRGKGPSAALAADRLTYRRASLKRIVTDDEALVRAAYCHAQILSRNANFRNNTRPSTYVPAWDLAPIVRSDGTAYVRWDLLDTFNRYVL